VPAALLFLSLGAPAFALVPRASTAIAYGLVGLAFAWELYGALLDLPGWLFALSHSTTTASSPPSHSRPVQPRS
jgi:putative exporter of polyketide antibiotics